MNKQHLTLDELQRDIVAAVSVLSAIMLGPAIRRGRQMNRRPLSLSDEQLHTVQVAARTRVAEPAGGLPRESRSPLGDESNDTALQQAIGEVLVVNWWPSFCTK